MAADQATPAPPVQVLELATETTCRFLGTDIDYFLAAAIGASRPSQCAPTT